MITRSHAAHYASPAGLQRGEVLRVSENIPQIVYYRRGKPNRPLAVFLPGGGHLARVAYGHANAQSRDFLDHWLDQAGLGLLALSYPSDHPAFPAARPDVTISQWAASIARIVQEHVDALPNRQIVLLAWSMAGRATVPIERALRSIGSGLTCFISLAATAPLPNLFPASSARERFTPEGFWDASTRHAQWLAQLKDQPGAAGRAVLDAQTYLEHYVVNSPFSLRAQPPPSGAFASEAMLADQNGAFAYEDYPPVAAIIPESSADPLHALTDRSVWGAINVLRIARAIRGAENIDAHNWSRLRALLDDVPRRLCRTVPGAHFFFIGEAGAKATVQHIVDLTNEINALDEDIRKLCTQS